MSITAPVNKHISTAAVMDGLSHIYSTIISPVFLIASPLLCYDEFVFVSYCWTLTALMSL